MTVDVDIIQNKAKIKQKPKINGQKKDKLWLQ